MLPMATKTKDKKGARLASEIARKHENQVQYSSASQLSQNHSLAGTGRLRSAGKAHVARLGDSAWGPCIADVGTLDPSRLNSASSHSVNPANDLVVPRPCYGQPTALGSKLAQGSSARFGIHVGFGFGEHSLAAENDQISGAWSDGPSTVEGDWNASELHEIEDKSVTPPFSSPLDSYGDADAAFIIKLPSRSQPQATLYSASATPTTSLRSFQPPPLPSYPNMPLPKPYNSAYPHPIGVYASAHVNPAAVKTSGFDTLLAHVAQNDPSVLAAAQIDPAVLAPLKPLEEGNENASPTILAILHEAARLAEVHPRKQIEVPPRFRRLASVSLPHTQSQAVAWPSRNALIHSASSRSLASLAEDGPDSVTPCTPPQYPRRRESMPIIVGQQHVTDEPTHDFVQRRVSMPLMTRVGAPKLEHVNVVRDVSHPDCGSTPVTGSTSKYKTEACQTFWLRGSCDYGRYCVFLHSELDPAGGIPGVTRLLDAGLPQIEQERINAEVYNFMHATQLEVSSYSPCEPVQFSTAPHGQTPRRASSDMAFVGIEDQQQSRRHWRSVADLTSRPQLSMNRSSSLNNLHELEHHMSRFNPFGTSPSRTPQPQSDASTINYGDTDSGSGSGRHLSDAAASMTTTSSISSRGKPADGSWDYTAQTSIWR